MSREVEPSESAQRLVGICAVWIQIWRQEDADKDRVIFIGCSKAAVLIYICGGGL